MTVWYYSSKHKHWIRWALDNNQPASFSREAQQQGLVAVTIRDSVMFYSTALQRPDFHSVTEFRYLYGVDSIKLFYRWKKTPWSFLTIKNTINKAESRRYRFYWYLRQILTIRLRDLFDHKWAWTSMIALSSKLLCGPNGVTSQIL